MVLSYHKIMYWVLDALCFFTGIIALVLHLYNTQLLLAAAWFVWIWVYPLMLEGLYNLMSMCLQNQLNYSVKNKTRFVYHPNYNLDLWGLQKFHPFDSQKYSRIFQKIIDKGLIKLADVVRPDRLNRHFLLQKMSKLYLLKLCYSYYICKYIEVPFWFLPGWVLRWRILNPMLLATQGSIVAANLAKSQGWAINLAGGFHHASWDQGGGFCIYPDISFTVHYIQTRLKMVRVMIIDLDAHQGNGHEKDFVVKESVYIVDCYNHKIYPKDSQVKEAIGKNMPIQHSTSNAEYLQLVEQIKQDLQYFHPQFVIYNAGTDVLIDDPLGKLQISRQAIIERDQKVIGMCIDNKIPVVMLLSGGYQSTNADIIADSISNLMNKFN